MPHVKKPQDWIGAMLNAPHFARYAELFEILRGQDGYFCGDSMVTAGRNLSFLRDKKFNDAFMSALDRYENQAYRAQLMGLIWRKHILATSAKNCLALDGDFVECGVDYGFGVDIVSTYLNFENCPKNWYLYDTFCGVPPEQIDKGTKPNADILPQNQFAAVQEKFKHQPRFKIIQGIVPKSFDKALPTKIAFLHIDMNNAQAELYALKMLIDRIEIGGHIVLDDFGWVAFAFQQISQIEFFNILGLSVMELPTGQGLLVKTKHTNASDIDVEEILKNLPEHVACPNWG